MMLLLSLGLRSSQLWATEAAHLHVPKTSPHFISGDVLFMLDKEEKIKHIAIYHPNKNSDKNIVSAFLNGISYVNLEQVLVRHTWHVQGFRHDPKNLSEKEKHQVRLAIGSQAELWYDRMKKHGLNKYNYPLFSAFLLVQYAGKAKKMHFEREANEVKRLLRFVYDHPAFPNATVLSYLHYALRQKTLPTLNRGFTCGSFALAVIGTGLLHKVTAPYAIEDQDWETLQLKSETSWPSLKHVDKKTPTKYDRRQYDEVVDFINQISVDKYYDRKRFQQLLHVMSPNLTPEKSDRGIKDHQPKIRVPKISLANYLEQKDINVIDLMHVAQEQLGGIGKLNTKNTSLQTLFVVLLKDHENWKPL